MSYPDSVRYLYALGNELKAGAKFGLERMHTLLGALGHPEAGQRLVHIAGTNGKGSTAAFLAAILQQSGARTGLYTSPHLIEPNERIQIDGANVTPDEFAAAFAIVHDAAEALLRKHRIDAHPSYFETVTAMALLMFRERAEIAVIEVGLGGRLDATNVISPELCVITPVSYDHEAYLGSSLQSIAWEKAGILKPRVPVVLGIQQPQASEVILQRADQLRCPVTQVTKRAVEIQHIDAYGSKFCLNNVEYDCVLPGRHQVENAAAAVLAARQLGVAEEAIQAGLKSATWPGRLEFIAHDPDFVLDGAHNPAGASVLAAYIREFCAHRPVWLIYGAMRDKAIEEVTECLFPLADRLVVTAPKIGRALRPDVILEVTSHAHAIIAGTVAEAVEIARTAPREAIVFFTGSLYLVGEVKELLPSGSSTFS